MSGLKAKRAIAKPATLPRLTKTKRALQIRAAITPILLLARIRTDYGNADPCVTHDGLWSLGSCQIQIRQWIQRYLRDCSVKVFVVLLGCDKTPAQGRQAPCLTQLLHGTVLTRGSCLQGGGRRLHHWAHATRAVCRGVLRAPRRHLHARRRTQAWQQL